MPVQNAMYPLFVLIAKSPDAGRVVDWPNRVGRCQKVPLAPLSVVLTQREKANWLNPLVAAAGRSMWSSVPSKSRAFPIWPATESIESIVP